MAGGESVRDYLRVNCVHDPGARDDSLVRMQPKLKDYLVRSCELGITVLKPKWRMASC